jgi:hypothetical protein
MKIRRNQKKYSPNPYFTISSVLFVLNKLACIYEDRSRTRMKVFTRSRSRIKMMRLRNTVLKMYWTENCEAEPLQIISFFLNLFFLNVAYLIFLKHYRSLPYNKKIKRLQNKVAQEVNVFQANS